VQVDDIPVPNIVGLHVSEKDDVVKIVPPVAVTGIAVAVAEVPKAFVMPMAAEGTLAATVTLTTAATPFCMTVVSSPIRMH
jgi:hypothetical protein